MAKRDYKDEYKKFQKHKSGYRAKLNKYNRKKGTYGNGDGLDASHKGGKIPCGSKIFFKVFNSFILSPKANVISSS